MAYPPGVQLATLTFSNPSTFLGGEAARSDVTVEASASVVWAATGQPIDNFEENVSPGGGLPGSLTVPFVDQPGFTDQSGNAFTSWAYVVTRRTTFGNKTKMVRKNWQPVLGQGAADFDTLPGGPIGLPVSAPVVTVTSVGGFTGAVTAEQLAAALPVSRNPDTFPAGTALQRTTGGKQIVGVDGVNSRYFFVDDFTLWEINEPDFAASQTTRGLPPGVTQANMGNSKLLWFKGTYYLSALSGGLASIWQVEDPDKPLDGNGDGWWSWAPILKQGVTGSTVMGPAFNTDGEYLYWGEYGQPAGGPSLYRSIDGTTWETCLTVPNPTNHAHGINADPYQPGHVYATFGDASQLKHMRSTNYGAPGTWEELPGSGSVTWQADQISFTEDHVYYGSDSNLAGWTAFRWDKAANRMEALSHDWHYMLAVPGGRAGRFVADLVFTDGSTTMTSATANFTSADVGAMIRGAHTAIVDNTVIRSVVDASSVVVSTAALADSGTTTATITGDMFYGAAFYGAIDPATNIYYCVANDSSAVGNTAGLFAITPDGRLHLLKVLPRTLEGDLYLAAGFGWWGQYKWPLLSA